MTDALIPLAALVRRELVRTLRINRSLFMLTLLVGIPAICVAAVWPMEDDPVFTVRRVTEMITQFCIVGLFITAVLILPAQAATAVRGERDRDTLAMLLLTRISPRAMLIGHALNCFGLFALYAIATLPIVCTAYLLTGLDWRAIPVQYGIIAVAAINCIVAGLVCTSFSTTTPRAVIGAYLLAAIMLGGYVIIIQMLTGLVAVGIMGMDQNPFIYTRLLWGASPPGLLLDRVANGFIFTGISIYSFGAGIHIAISIVGAGIALIGFMRLRKEKILSVPEVSAAASLRSRISGQTVIPFRDTYNLVFQREFRVLMQGWWRTRRLRFGTFLLVGIVFAVAAYVIVFVDTIKYAGQEADMEHEIMSGWVMGCVAVICMIAPGVSTPLWIRERDQDTREQLIMTLLRPKQIIFGKAAAAVAVTLAAGGIWMIAASPLLLRGIYNAWTAWMPALWAIPMLVMLALTLVAIGSQTPHMRVKSTAAIALSYALGIAYIAFPVYFQEVFGAMMLTNKMRTILECVTLAISPFGAWIATTYKIVQVSGIPTVLYWAFALMLQFIAVYLFLRDSIRNESVKVRKGSAS